MNTELLSQQGRTVIPSDWGRGAVDFDTLLPLEYLRPGEWADVAEVTGEPGWVGRLAELGLRTGCRLVLLQPGWPCLLQIGDSRLSLRGEEGTRILVRPVTF
jgi:Fe2+ transport system protein FeoA